MIGKTKYRGDRPTCVYGVAPSRTAREKRKYGTSQRKFATVSAAMKHVKYLLFGEHVVHVGLVNVYKLCGRKRRRVVKACRLNSSGRMECNRRSRPEVAHRDL